jgi:uncharacterized protein
MNRSDLQERARRLHAGLCRLDSVLVAFSGGVDSSLLLAAAARALPGRVVAATAEGPHHPAEAFAEAARLAAWLGVPHRRVRCGEWQDPAFRANGPQRCYHCKHRLLTVLLSEARREGLARVIHGANADDRAEERPGMRAADELGVSAPLLEAGLDKAAVRRLAREMGLPNWDAPAMSCLATRIPRGTPLRAEDLARVAAAERSLAARGLRGGRVRCHGDWARIELPPEDIPRLAAEALRLPLVEELRRAGFRVVTLDLAGYRPGGGQPQRSGDGEA